MKSKVACYLRVSTKDKQDYVRQETELMILCEQQGHSKSDIEIYAEKISGYTTEEDRPEMNKLLATIDKNPKYYSMVYCTEISRIGRKGKIIRDIIDKLKSHKIPLFIKNLGLKTLDDNGQESIATNIIVSVFSEIADEYARTFKANSISGLRQAASVGKAGGSNNHAYGYTKKEKKGLLVIEHTEAKVIRDIFSLYKSGNGIKVISGILNNRKVPTRMNKTHKGRAIKVAEGHVSKEGSEIRWSDKQVHDILRNSLYCGKRRFKGEIFDAPAIISAELFEECSRIMKGKTHRNYLTTYTFLLKDRIICGVCGRNYFGRFKPVKGGDKVYICSSRLINGGNCGNCGCNISLIESAIYDQLLGADNVLKYFSNTRGMKTELSSTVTKLEQSLIAKKNVLEKKSKSIERLDDSYFNDGVPQKDIYYKRRNKLENDLTLIDSSVALIKSELADKRTILSKLDEKKATKTMLLNAKHNRAELQAIFRQIISKVIVNKLDNNKVLATVYLSLNGLVIRNTIKLILDLSGIRKKPIEYKYKAISKMGNDPVYKNNILLVDTSNILQEVQSVPLRETRIHVSNVLELKK